MSNYGNIFKNLKEKTLHWKIEYKNSKEKLLPWISEIKNLKEKPLPWYFDSKIGRKNHYLNLNEIHQKKDRCPFSTFCGKLCQIPFYIYILILIYFFKYETIVRFDVYACLDCNCWKHITVQCAVCCACYWII